MTMNTNSDIDDKDYSVEQIQILIDHAKTILKIVGLSTEPEAETVYNAMDDYCWHQPGCEPGDRCVSDEEGAQERLAREGGHDDTDHDHAFDEDR